MFESGCPVIGTRRICYSSGWSQSHENRNGGWEERGALWRQRYGLASIGVYMGPFVLFRVYE